MNCIIAVIGPTAVGKSALAVKIARQFGGEIINADSRQIYRYMDIGTAKPCQDERDSVPHHLLDIINPDQSYSVALYQEAASTLAEKLSLKGKVPFLVGGSGQYVWSVIEGWRIPAVEPDKKYREAREAEAREKGILYLHNLLESIDHVTAVRISPNNLRRVIRALEIFDKTGRKPSELQTKMGIGCPFLIVGLTARRQQLYTQIDQRAEGMVKSGFVDEVGQLLKLGYSPDLPSMSSLGYRQICQHLEGKVTLEEAVQRIKYETHRFARAQYAWFHLNDSRIRWFDVGSDIGPQLDYTINSFLSQLR